MYRWVGGGHIDVVEEGKRLEKEVLKSVSGETGIEYGQTGVGAAEVPRKEHILGITLIESGTRVNFWADLYTDALEHTTAAGLADYHEDFWFDDHPPDYDFESQSGTRTVALLMDSDDEVGEDYHQFADAVGDRMDAEMRLYSEKDATLYGWVFDLTKELNSASS